MSEVGLQGPETSDLVVGTPQTERTPFFGSVVDGMNAMGSIVILAVMAMMCSDVLIRNLAGRPLDGVAELAAASIVVIVFLQLPATLRHGRMSRAEMFLDPLLERRPATGRALRATFALIGSVCCAGIAFSSWTLLVRAWTDSEFAGAEGVFTFPVWPIRAVVILGSSVAALQYILLAWSDLTGAGDE